MFRLLRNSSKLFWLCFVFAFVSCQPSSPISKKAEVVLETEENKNEDSDNSDNRDYNDRNDSNRRSCSADNEESDKISIRDLDYIDSNNAGAYTLRGRCDISRASVNITVNGYKISDNPTCDNRRWEVELDLSAIASKEKTIVFQISHDGDSICKEIRVAFTGPPGYIPVPSLEDHYEFGFFVMKYEAKITSRSSSAKAVSQAEGAPLTRVTYEEAVKLCRNNGPRYDLINNSQWQNIVRSIEDTDENWILGKNTISDSNAINCGVLRGSPQPAKSNDNDDCADRSCKADWDVKRRTHILSNGERIWDICGNAGEMMKNKYTQGTSFKGDIYELSGQLKKLFGPDRTYNLSRSTRRTNKWNLGYADVKSSNNLIVRGMPGSYAGIFSVNVKKDQDERRGEPYVGFRCVYLP